MNAEAFQDAMNYLDDDLLEETDELRRGERVLYRSGRVRRVIRWLAPAACLVLVLGLTSRWASDSTESLNFGGNMAMDQEAGELPQMGAEGTQNEYSHTESWETVTVGTLSISVPVEWTWATESFEDGTFEIVFGPQGYDGGLKLAYMPGFGVCGTGLSEEETVIAGMRARVGTYGSGLWSFITFPDEAHWYVVMNEGADSWWPQYGNTAMKILETLVITEQEG